MALAEDREGRRGQDAIVIADRVFRMRVGIFVDVGEGEGGDVVGAGPKGLYMCFRPAEILRVSELFAPTTTEVGFVNILEIVSLGDRSIFTSRYEGGY